jgi:glycosyltransferase involved in cell wall biosynthesis
VATKTCAMTSAHSALDARIFHKQCRSLARGGYHVTLIAPGTDSMTRDGVEVEGVPRWANRWTRMLRGPCAVYRKALRLNADIYHFHDPELIPIALLLRFAGKTVVYDIHEDLPRTVSYKSYIPRWLRGSVSYCLEVFERWAARRFSALIAATPPIADRFRMSHSLVEVIHNYPRIEEIRPTPLEEDVASDGSLLYVGMRITRVRGAEEMVRAMGFLPPALGARLKIVGAWDPPSLVESLANIPGWDRIDCVGLVDRTELSRLLRRARAGLVLLHAEPNYTTAQPVKLFEYMCAGLPVIASDLPGCREIVQTSRCGLLVNPMDPRQVAQAIAYIFMYPEEAAEMGRRGFKAVQQRYNWASEEKSLLALYQRLSAPSQTQRRRAL